MGEARHCPVTGKRRHRTPESARRAARALRRVRDARLHPYRCPHCGGWHLTSQVSGLQRSPEQRRRANGRSDGPTVRTLEELQQAARRLRERTNPASVGKADADDRAVCPESNPRHNGTGHPGGGSEP